MFNKKSCKKCGNAIKDNYSFCPNCGFKLDSKEDWGMLGKSDTRKQPDPFQELFKGTGIAGGILGKMANNAIKMLEKEMQREMNDQQPRYNQKVKIMINGKEVNPNPKKPTQVKKIPLPKFNKNQITKSKKLERKEPQTTMKRLSNSIIYEIKLPGVKEEKDLDISQFENSIEIKALAKDKVYFKILPISMPILEYELDKGKLIIELEARD